ncbi:hypothetical protein HD554DRAFT_2013329 [Boletus coccyginus]|nr:hypothetical protein HD554DRAFT_2013329 [Boletus coccyginus]
MTTTNTTLPPLDKTFMIGIWVETVLYGMSGVIFIVYLLMTRRANRQACVMYALSMLIVLRGGRVTRRWTLVVMSTALILVATVHVGASLQQLLEAFVYLPADVPNYSTTYWLNDDATPNVVKNFTFLTLVCNTCALIWRLYVVFMYDWRVIVFPVANTPLGTAYPGMGINARPDVDAHNPVVTGLFISAWVLDIALNVSVTMAIAGRLWWMGRKTAPSTSTRTNPYALSVYATVESGAIFAGANIISLALYISNSPVFLATVSVASQVAALAPLLIIVQVGLTAHDRSSRSKYSKTAPTAQDRITFRVGSSQDRDSESQQHSNSSLDYTLSSSPNFVHGAQGHTKYPYGHD